jgi:hypothetical protein
MLVKNFRAAVDRAESGAGDPLIPKPPTTSETSSKSVSEETGRGVAQALTAYYFLTEKLRLAAPVPTGKGDRGMGQ